MTAKPEHPSLDPEPDSVIYITGTSPNGTALIGGVWKLWTQEGFPLEMSHIVCRDNGWRVDWCEAMADASCTNNLPSLVRSIEAFLPDETMSRLKLGFEFVMRDGKTYEQVVADKKANGAAFDRSFRDARVKWGKPLPA